MKRPPRPRHSRFADDARELLALVAEVEVDGDLLDAARKLLDVSLECDRAADRFDEAAEEVRRLLVSRMKEA